MHKLAIILPCYNEQEVLPITIKILTDYLKTLINRDIISNDSFICFVDDGSKDDTWNIIEKYREQSGGGGLRELNYHQTAAIKMHYLLVYFQILIRQIFTYPWMRIYKMICRQ